MRTERRPHEVVWRDSHLQVKKGDLWPWTWSWTCCLQKHEKAQFCPFGHLVGSVVLWELQHRTKVFFFTGGHLLFYSIPERKVSYYSETRGCCSSNNYVRLFSIMIDDFCGTRYWKRSTDTFSYGLVLTREDFHIARGQESCSDSHKIIFSFNSLCTTIIYYFRRMRSKEADQK